MSAEWIWRNGEFVKWDEATVHVSAHALHYGSSVFEGIRAYSTPDGAAVFRLREHSERLLHGARIMRIDHDNTAESLDAAILETVRRNRHQSCYIRPIIFRGAGALGLEGRKNTRTETVILTFEWGRYLGAEAIEQGVDVQISSFRRMAPDTHMALVKAGGNYVNSQFVSMEAHDNGFEEGIALDVHGYVSEGAGENIFVVLNGAVYTPGAWSSILMGITRDSALTILADMGLEVRFQPVAREMLYMAEEIFFTGTAAEVTPVKSVDRIPVGCGGRGPITEAVQSQFFAITAGEAPDKHGWLTHV
ncbi:MAG: branched-chain amino acid transaminase [Chloroflexi bacterium]|nr:branched-chain amino acid transaminase [Chloroflexota bacterium]MCY4248100.1 branched-chain amino acid transaminase [Chloroflexota bacterium]